MRRISITCVLICIISVSYSITFEEVEKLVSQKNDSITVEILDSIAWANRSNNVDLAFQVIQKSLSISKKFKNPKQYAKGLITLSKVYGNKKQFDLSIRIAKESISILLENNDTLATTSGYIQLGNIYYVLGSYEKALLNYFAALRIAEKYNSEETIALTFGNIGNIYNIQGNYDKALSFYIKALPYFENKDKSIRKALFIDNISNVYFNKKQYAKALFYNLSGLNMLDSVVNRTEYADFLLNTGNIQMEMGNLDSAIFLLNKANRIAVEKSNLSGMILSKLDLSEVYFRKLNYQQSLKELTGLVDTTKKYHLLNLLSLAYEQLYLNYEKLGRIDTAYHYFKLRNAVRDSVFNDEDITLRNELNVRYEAEQKEKELGILEEKTELQEKVLARNKIISYVMAACALLLILIVVLFYRGSRIRKKANMLLQARNSQVQQQKKIIELKNKDILDSINYAQKIQLAILPDSDEIKRILPNSFVLFKPKDIVSGDFYWIANKNNQIIIAAADCTGHGVPGALMSMIGNTLLNEIVNTKGITTPSDILFQLREGIIHTLKQTGATGENKDGMDIALCCIDLKKMTLDFAGANNPLYYFNTDGFNKIQGDKQPIGIYSGEAKAFSNHQISIKSGDTIYLFTDGFADQFGGEKGKKFKYKQLQELLEKVNKKPVVEQKNELYNSFESWKGNLEQVDDVCLIGIKI